ncbi:MAG: hypothetical protein ACHQ1D_02380 [Nitrososphaerales archaeon]
MSDYSLYEEQVKESGRGPRIIGEIPSIPISHLNQNFSNNNVAFGQSSISTFNMISSPKQIEGMFIIGQWEPQITRTPFELSFNEFSTLHYAEMMKLQDEAYKSCNTLLADAWARGKRQVIICDKRIVYETESDADLPNSFVEQIARQHDKACYVFVSPDIVEECQWSLIDSNDHYPTLSVYIGDPNLDSSKIDKEFTNINADFDTGNPKYKIFPSESFPSSLVPVPRFGLRNTNHLAKHYYYFDKDLQICVRSTGGIIHSVTCPVRIVTDWNNGALLQANPNRLGFVGRDLIRQLMIKIELDPIKNTTRIMES